MDDANARSHIQEHADAVVRGDMDAVIADFSEELRPQVPELAKALPQPVTEAEIHSIEVGDEQVTATIRYAGDSSEVTIRSRWREIDGRPLIVHAEPVG
jgi:hypothetical protein